MFHKAAARSEIQEVVASDRRWDDQRGPLPNGAGGRCVLQQLRHLVASNHRPRRHGEVAADHELATLDRGRHTPVGAHIGEPVAHTACQARSARVQGPLERRRIARKVVGGRGGAGRDAGKELRRRGVPEVQVLEIVQQVVHGAAAGQIALHGLVERAAVLPGWIVETPVALRGLNFRASEPDADEFCGQHGRLAASGRGLPQHEGRARQHLAHQRPPSRIRTGDRVQGLVCHAGLPYRINSLLYLTALHLGTPARTMATRWASAPARAARRGHR